MATFPGPKLSDAQPVGHLKSLVVGVIVVLFLVLMVNSDMVVFKLCTVLLGIVW